jgi:hypothetical protein
MTGRQRIHDPVPDAKAGVANAQANLNKSAETQLKGIYRSA